MADDCGAEMSRDSLHDRMAGIITRIAQHACRQGEKGTRKWPALHELPLRKSWEMIGEEYAEQALCVLLVGLDEVEE